MQCDLSSTGKAATCPAEVTWESSRVAPMARKQACRQLVDGNPHPPPSAHLWPWHTLLASSLQPLVPQGAPILVRVAQLQQCL